MIESHDDFREKSTKSMGLSIVPVSLQEDHVVRGLIEDTVRPGSVECGLLYIGQRRV